MADVIDELLQPGTVDPALLAELLRRKEEHGMAAALSGSKRLGPTGGVMRAEALDTATGLGEQAETGALARWKAAMALQASRERNETTASEGRMNRQNRLDVAGLRNRGTLDAISARAAAKAGASNPDAANDIAESTARHAEDMMGVLDEAIRDTDGFSSGVLSLSKMIPGTPAANLEEKLSPVASTMALQKLEEMRRSAAAMGMKGSGLGQVTERELALLINHIRSVDIRQSPGQLRSNLRVLRDMFRESARKIRAEMNKAGMTPSDGDDIDALLQDALGNELGDDDLGD